MSARYSFFVIFLAADIFFLRLGPIISLLLVAIYQEVPFRSLGGRTLFAQKGHFIIRESTSRTGTALEVHNVHLVHPRREDTENIFNKRQSGDPFLPYPKRVTHVSPAQGCMWGMLASVGNVKNVLGEWAWMTRLAGTSQ